jgi:hypothetical protein
MSARLSPLLISLYLVVACGERDDLGETDPTPDTDGESWREDTDTEVTHGGRSCGSGGDVPSIEQGVYGHACWFSDIVGNNSSGPMQEMAAFGPRGEVGQAEPNEVGFYEIALEPGRYMLCELGYQDCTWLTMEQDLVECDASVAPPPVYWSGGCGVQRDWPLWAFFVEGSFGYDAEGDVITTVIIDGVEQRPTLDVILYHSEYTSSGDPGDSCTIRMTAESSTLLAERWSWSDELGDFEQLGFSTRGQDFAIETSCGDEAWLGEDWFAEVLAVVLSNDWGVAFGDASSDVQEAIDEGVEPEDVPYYFGGGFLWSGLGLNGTPEIIAYDYANGWAVQEREDGRLELLVDGEDERIPLVSSHVQQGASGLYEIHSFYGFYIDYL